MSKDNLAVKANDIKEKLPFWRIGTYGMGNFASQLSWTMVSTYLAVFYTDAVGLSAAAVATLLLIARIWDAINDPIMGMVMERTRTRWGRFRPYILFGAPFLTLGTILCFRNPGLGGNGNLIYAYVTYILLGMIYTMVNVPYQALPNAITKNRDDTVKLGVASMVGENAGMILLNMITLPLVAYFGKGNLAKGYASTNMILAFAALILFWCVFAGTKEVIHIKKENTVPFYISLKLVLTSRNVICVILFNIICMFGIMGRIGIAVYYYMYVAERPDLIGIFMSLPSIVGLVVGPIGAVLAEKFGRKKIMCISQICTVAALLLIFLGDPFNLPYMIFCHVLYGTSFLGSSISVALLRDAIDKIELESGVRVDGTVAGLNGLSFKSASALGTSAGLVIIGMAGYVGGQTVTPAIADGINRAVNLVPAIVVLLALVPLAIYKMSEKEAKEIQDKLEMRRSEQYTATEETGRKQ